ncbi:hypothetical protein KEM56_007615 [Ascosphaera pollenicola]|nr:hypothetical protein KEM56_007615 [Ascosphaera pollenicola]
MTTFVENRAGAGYQLPNKAVSWSKRDALLFASSIGIEADELHFLYELHPHFAVFPTYPIVLSFKGTAHDVVDFLKSDVAYPIPGVPDLDRSRAVDGERKITLIKPLPTSSEGRRFELESSVVGVYDKGKATVVETEQRLVDADTEDVYMKTVGSIFYVGQGGWGGPKGQSWLLFGPMIDVHISSLKVLVEGPSAVSYKPPQGKSPDFTHELQTTQSTPLFYRLNGDYNPLHACPEQGTRMGFGGVIIHGLFSWNVAAHALVKLLGGSNPASFKEYQARFAAPVLPGDKIITSIWRIGKLDAEGYEEVLFVVKNGKGKVVLSNGRALVAVADQSARASL